MTFPEDFVWGAATSSYQIEGDRAGRADSIWDAFSAAEGAVAGGETGTVACDHVGRYAEDVELMRRLGLDAYRLSIAWPRVLPDGTGAASAEGLGFYDRLVDELLGAGVTPYVTLYHWDLPVALQARGGWQSPEAPGWFEHYAGVVADRLGDRVRDWMTLNEPQVFLALGLETGRHAPGLRLPPSGYVPAVHHALMAHGRGLRAIRASSRLEARVGWAPVAITAIPRGPSDVEAARARMFGMPSPTLWSNTLYFDPVLEGAYPEDVLTHFGAHLPRGWEGDMETIHAGLDFMGLNIYHGELVGTGPDGRPQTLDHPLGGPRTSFDWPVTPEALYWGPRLMHERYAIPVYITENGLSNNDWVALDGRVHDPQRIDFTRRYLLALRRAVADGVDVRGYFHWSLLDNFEWAEGYHQRFGLVHVDFATGQRTPKDSFEWYRGVIGSRGAELDDPGGRREAVDLVEAKPAPRAPSV